MTSASRRVLLIIGGAVLAAMVLWVGFAALSGWLVDSADRRPPQSLEAIALVN